MKGLKMDDEITGTFRREVREWLIANFPPSLKGEDFDVTAIEGPIDTRPDYLRWREAVASRGWGVPSWPVAYGGADLSEAEAAVLAEELAQIGAANPIAGMGVLMLGPTLLEFGTEKQKLQHLLPIARGEVRWCQGYSEPNAGSDLASLQTRAEDRGDHFLVNGQKVWTSGAHLADWCFALVRTDKDKHRGISFLLIDMSSPGVEARPVRMISGQSPFCETFFTDVRVAKGNLVGELGQGWRIGKRLLQHERSGISGGGRIMAGGPSLAEIATEQIGLDANGRIADAGLRTRVIDWEMDWRAFLATVRRISGESRVSVASSILKVAGTQLLQQREELLIDIHGLQGLGWSGDGFSEAEIDQVRDWLFDKAVTIYGGSSEVQINIIAKRILEMPDHV